MPKKKQTRTVLVTGAYNGIGLATSTLLARHGYRLILLDRAAADREKALQLVATAGATTGLQHTDIEAINCDLTDTQAIKASVLKLRLLQEGLFGLVNNAATEIIKPLENYPLPELETTWKVNMLAPIVMIQTCLPFLKRAKGSVVNISSIADRQRSPGYSVYGASKAFMNSLGAHLATELGDSGVRINTVSPGGVDTPLMRQIEAQFSPEEVARDKSRIPIERRWGRPEEIAEAIVFCLEGPKYLHGADLRIDGGSY